MANKNRNLVNNTNGTENKAEKPGWFKQKLESCNAKKVAKTAGKVIVGFCALVGAAGLGSYAADQIGKPKSQPTVDNPVSTDDI